MDVLWSCQGRVNLVDVDFLKALKKHGCVSLGYGIESGSDTILTAMNKRATVQQTIAAMRAAEEAGLDVKIQLIFGYPGENKQTIEETIRLFKALRSPGRRFNIIWPIPGSALYQQLIEARVIEDELEYMKNLEAALDMNLPIVNLTELDDDEIKLMASRTEGIILLNYVLDMALHNPRRLLGEFSHSRGSWRTVFWYLTKLGLTYCKPLFNALLRHRYPTGYRVYSSSNRP